mmetsp:Transcript_12844/g.36664  ORF Transcript_12844/g.36664 Transcript_12844/m.36664 type:complete len:273 (+) Transcript_12844:1193-2011(+)
MRGSVAMPKVDERCGRGLSSLSRSSGIINPKLPSASKVSRWLLVSSASARVVLPSAGSSVPWELHDSHTSRLAPWTLCRRRRCPRPSGIGPCPGPAADDAANDAAADDAAEELAPRDCLGAALRPVAVGPLLSSWASAECCDDADPEAWEQLLPVELRRRGGCRPGRRLTPCWACTSWLAPWALCRRRRCPFPSRLGPCPGPAPVEDDAADEDAADEWAPRECLLTARPVAVLILGSWVSAECCDDADPEALPVELRRRGSSPGLRLTPCLV